MSDVRVVAKFVPADEQRGKLAHWAYWFEWEEADGTPARQRYPAEVPLDVAEAIIADGSSTLRARVAELERERDSARDLADERGSAYSAELAAHGRTIKVKNERIAELHSALDLADCTQREGGDARHCGEVRCWRCRAEAAEGRVAESERDRAQMSEEFGLPPTMRPVEGEIARFMAESKANRARAIAAEQRAKRLEGALRGAVELIEQTEWTAFSVNDAKKLQAARAALAAGESQAAAPM